MTEGIRAGKDQYEVLSPAIFCNEIPQLDKQLVLIGVCKAKALIVQE